MCEVLGYTPPSVVLSGQLERAFILEEVNLFLNQIEDVVRVYNAARKSLAQAGIDPQVRPLAEDYLPLFYSCEAVNRRLRL